MPAVLIDNQGRPLSNGTGVYTTDDIFIPPTFTGTVDVEGLTALGWDSDDISWLQQNVWWDKEDNDYWKVTEANLAFGPNGSTPLTWANRATIKDNPDVRYFPKFDPSPSSSTSWANLFSGYKYLYAIPTHGWNVSNVTTFYGLFNSCYNLVSIGDLTNWNTSSLTSTALYRTFNYCTNLKNIGKLDNWNIQNVTSLQETFAYCYKLEIIGNLSNWNTSKITTMYCTFYNCARIYDIGDLTNWNVGNVTTFASMFYYCINLNKLVGLKNWNISKVTSLASMFYGCMNLNYIDDLTNWNVSNVTSFSCTFYCCYTLTRIGDLSNWNTAKLKNIYLMFGSCYLLKDIGDLSNWNVSLINGTSTSTGFISAFSSCNNLKRIGDLSKWTLNLSGTKNQMNSMFSGCSSMQHLNVRNWDVSKVINFTYTFSGCRNLQELDLYGWDLSANVNSGTSTATSIFANMYSIKRLVLGPKFFNSESVVTYYFANLYCWTRDSMIESLYTNQTLRTSNSTLITIQLATTAFDRLKNDLPTGFTLVDSTNILIDSKNIKLVRT